MKPLNRNDGTKPGRAQVLFARALVALLLFLAPLHQQLQSTSWPHIAAPDQTTLTASLRPAHPAVLASHTEVASVRSLAGIDDLPAAPPTVSLPILDFGDGVSPALTNWSLPSRMSVKAYQACGPPTQTV